MSKYNEFDLDIKSTYIERNEITPKSIVASITCTIQCSYTFTSSCDEVSVTTPCGSSRPLARC